jgi:hypothetical protein
MARIRSVHPGLFTDEAFASVTPLARLLFIGIWTEADDQGAFLWKPLTLKMRLFPAEDGCNVAGLMEELEASDMVRRYSVDGRDYGAVRNFGRFQRPKKPNSLYPMPHEFRTYAASDKASSELDGDEGGASSEPVPNRTPEKQGGSSPPVPPKSEKSPQMEDGGGRREEERTPHTPRKRGESPLEGFDRFWALYPRKVGKGAAEKAWPKAVAAAEDDPNVVVGGVQVGLDLGRFDLRDGMRFVPHPATWLNEKRWLDGIQDQPPEPSAAPSLFGAAA